MVGRGNSSENRTDLVISDSVSNIIHEFGHNADIVVVFCVIFGLGAYRHRLKLVFDPIEGAGKESAQDQTGSNQGDRRKQLRTSHRSLGVNYVLVDLRVP